MFNHSLRGLALVALALSLACAPTRTGEPPASSPAPMTGQAETASPMAAMPYDAMFLDMMTAHHQQAVEMAREILPLAKRDEVRQLAQSILDTQQREIETMEGWRQAWYPDVPKMDHGQMSGMMGSPEAPASQDPEERFLAEMIPHHEEAVRMSQEALARAEHEEIRNLARGIISAQEREISDMRGWLEDRTGEGT